MNDFVTQIVCGARGFDIEDSGWGQLLVFVIVAVIYALGSIAKMKKGKTEEGEEPAEGGSEQGGLRPATKSTGRLTADRSGKQQMRAPRTAQRATIRPVSDRRPEVAKVQPTPISTGKQIIELAAKTSSKMETTGVPIPSEVPVPAYLPEILSDYADPEKVRKVILHYEILGKPLSLREPTDKDLC